MTEAQAYLEAIERLERAQLEILAVALFREAEDAAEPSRRRGWQAQAEKVRDRYRRDAHFVMQGEEPVAWRKAQ